MANKVPVKHGCGGEIVQDAGAFICLGCGKEWVTNKEKHTFYEQYRQAIQETIVELGPLKARMKWHIPSGTFCQLLKRWTSPETPPVTPSPGPGPDGRLPALPAFSDKWGEKVQIEWLRVYENIVRLGTEVGGTHEQSD